ncbi:hypothetical protein MVEN_01426500 [Mycena venus]|uniref:DUF6534 domain-containing protein n=1 Tax=Mycena venus TaxID=2733690 RepID=A0A8H7CVN1_9AGAR|nr:hypothetical protein MVEN_01426500 [Mycena venus]
MSTSLPRLDSITGALLVGTWVSSLLYTAEMLQAVYYFRNFKKDDWKVKTFVAVAFVIDTISALGDYAAVYLYTITHAADPVYLSKQNWAVPLYIISTSCVAILVQSFLAFRCWRFTKNPILVVLLTILILAAFGGGFASGLVIVLFPALKDRMKVRVSGQVWIFTQVAADLIIAGALVYEFRKVKSKFLGGRRQIHNTLHRLVVLTLQTGLATAVIAVVALIIFLANDETNIPVGIMYSLGRVYVLSMLLNLNIRVSGSQGLSQGTSQAPTSVAFAQGTGTSNTDGLGGVQFRSAILTNSHLHPPSRHDLNGTVKSSSTKSHTTETPPADIEMMATDSSKKQSDLLVV